MKFFLSKEVRILFGLMLFAVGFSVLFLLHQSLRLDEAQSLWQTSRSPLGILKIIALDVHVPFYHLMLFSWQRLFGNSVETARILSLIFFVATIPMMYLLGRLTYSRNVSLYAATLLTISPFLNWYGSETRMYSLLMFLAVTNHYFFLKLYKKESKASWIGYCLTAVLGTYTHYLFFAHLATQVFFLLLQRKKISTPVRWKFAASYLGVAVFFAPWISYVISQGSASNTKPLIVPPTAINVFNSFAQFLFGFQTSSLNTSIVSLWPLAVLFIFFGLQRYRRMTSETEYFILSFILPVVTVFAFSLAIRPFFLSRYLIFVVPPFYLALSWLFSTYGRSAWIIRSLIIVGMVGALIVQARSTHTPVREDYKQAVEYLNQTVTGQDVVVASAPFTVYPIEYYYSGPASIETLPNWNRLNSSGIEQFDPIKLPAQVDKIAAYRRKVCLVLSYDQGYEEKVFQYFEASYPRTDTKVFSDGLRVLCYKASGF